MTTKIDYLNIKPKRMKMNCDNCKKTFFIFNWDYKKCIDRNQKHFFCSHKCHDEFRRAPMCMDNIKISKFYKENIKDIRRIVCFFAKDGDYTLKDALNSKAMITVSNWLAIKEHKKQFKDYFFGSMRHTTLEWIREKRKERNFIKDFSNNHGVV